MKRNIFLLILLFLSLADSWAGELKRLRQQISGMVSFRTFEQIHEQKLSFKGCRMQIVDQQQNERTLGEWDLKMEYPIRSQKRITKGNRVIQLWGIHASKSQFTLYFPQQELREMHFERIKRVAELCKAKEMVFPKRKGLCRSLVSEMSEIRDGLGDLSDQVRMLFTSLTLSNSPSYVEKAIFKQVNQYRRQKGLRPLKWSAHLAQIARQHGQDMEQRRKMDHQGFPLRAQQIHELGPFRGIVENVAYNFGKENPALSAFLQWKGSPGHEANMLKSWGQDQEGLTAVNATRGKDGHWYFTQLFAGKGKGKGP